MKNYQELVNGTDIQLALGLDIDELDDSGSTYTQEEKKRISMAARDKLELTPEKKLPSWYLQYRKLVDSGVPWRVACYMCWAATPKSLRHPETVEKFATETLGLSSARVIYNWRKKSPEMDEIVSMMQAAPMLEHRADVIQALVDSASKSDHRSNPDRKLFFEMTGDYVPRQSVDLSGGLKHFDVTEMSRADLEKHAARRKGRKNDSSD